MKKNALLYITVLLFLINNIAKAQNMISPEVKQLIDTTVALMQKQSVNAKKADWVQVKQNALLKAAHAATPYQAGNALRYLMQSVNDYHGTIFYGDSAFKYEPKPYIVSDSIRQQWNRRADIKTAMLNSRVGYLRVPSMVNGSKRQLDSLAIGLSDSLCRLLSHNKLKGLVLDLRINGGGAMYPMMLGLEQLLGQGRIGSSITGTTSYWIIKDHGFYLDNLMTSIKPTCYTNATTLPVAVVTGNATGSSGEFLAMTFKGRKNTVFVGETTGGYVTTITGYPLTKNAYIYLSTGYSADRTGHVYTEALKPDIPVSGPDKFNNLKQDAKIAAAAKWIEGLGR